MTEQRCLLIVTAEIDPELEAEWNRWYDTVHLPDALACPGVISGRRYPSVGQVGSSERGQRQVSSTRIYTTIYETTGHLGVSGHAGLALVCPACPLSDAGGDGAEARSVMLATIGGNRERSRCPIVYVSRTQS
jgi:hypothetical protein